MARILFMLCLCAMVDMLAVVAFVWFLATADNTRALFAAVVGAVLHGVLAPGPEELADLQAFLRQFKG